jgi:hypothetical protein
MNYSRIIMVVVLVMSVILLSVAPASAGANPVVLPPNARVQGHTLGEWSAIAWSSMFAIPASINPGLGAPWTDCYVERSGNVGVGVILFSPFSPFECTMPAGTKLFLDVATAECSTLEAPPFYGGNEEELRACALHLYYTNIQVTIVGVAIQNLDDYTVLSPMFQFTVPADNFFGVPGGTVGESVSYGTFLMLAPLDPGQHSIYIHAELPNFDFSFDQIFNITVTK